MSDENGIPRGDEDIETGEPIAELAALREDPSEGFAQRIRNSIQRRLLASQAADFSLRVFLTTLFDYLTAALDALHGQRPHNDTGDDDE